MPYVERTIAGKITGIYARKQDGYAEEFLAENNAEVVAFLNTPPVTPQVPGLIGSAGFTIADGTVATVELAAQLAGAYYEQGYVQVYFLETQTLPYLVFVQTDIPCKVEQYKEPGALELVFSDPLTGNPIDLGRIDLQILNVR